MIYPGVLKYNKPGSGKDKLSVISRAYSVLQGSRVQIILPVFDR